MESRQYKTENKTRVQTAGADRGDAPASSCGGGKGGGGRAAAAAASWSTGGTTEARIKAWDHGTSYFEWCLEKDSNFGSWCAVFRPKVGAPVHAQRAPCWSRGDARPCTRGGDLHRYPPALANAHPCA